MLVIAYFMSEIVICFSLPLVVCIDYPLKSWGLGIKALIYWKVKMTFFLNFGF